MPQPVHVDLHTSPGDLAARPELAVLIASIGLAWSNIEDELALLFAYGMQSEPAISAAIMGCTSNLATRLSMLRTALSLGVSEEAGTAFTKSFEQRIRKKAKARNLVVHSIWTIHASYPNDLIRTGGIMDPMLRSERYSKVDFLQIQIEILKLLESLKGFAESLPVSFPRRAATERPPFWRLVQQEPEEEDGPDQSDQTHPLE